MPALQESQEQPDFIWRSEANYLAVLFPFLVNQQRSAGAQEMCQRP